jgi:hypothetical protein
MYQYQQGKIMGIRMNKIRALFVLVFCMLNMRLYAGFSDLPYELKSIILVSLISSYSSDDITRCLQSIQNLSCVDKITRIFINDVPTTARIIQELVNNFNIPRKIDAAFLLAVSGAVPLGVIVWLNKIIAANRHHEKEEAESLLVSLAGQGESPESIIKIKMLLRAGVNINTYQEKQLGVFERVVERITPLVAAQKTGNKKVKALLLKHPEIDESFKSLVFK